MRDPVAIVIVPRERFSLIKTCVEHIYAFTSEPFELFAVDVKMPGHIREWLNGWAKQHSNLKIVASEKYLYPYEAKNLAMARIPNSIQWVAFVDSDVKVSPHWLTWLLKAAEETGARAVHPLYLIEQRGKVTIHMADGRFLKAKSDDRSLIHPQMNYVGRPISEAGSFKRIQSDFVEFHTFMVRRDLLDELGEFEPVALAEDVNFSFRLEAKKETIIFEPHSVITYVAGPPFEKYDLPYFRFRWNRQMGRKSIEFLQRRWPVPKHYWEGKLSWANFHYSPVSIWFRVRKSFKLWIADVQDFIKRGAKRLLPVGR